MKKLLSVLCASALALTLLAGCSNAASSSTPAESTDSAASSEPAASSEAAPAEEDAAAGTADTAKLEAIVTAIEAVNAISNPMVIDDFYLENFMNLTLDNIVAFQGDVTNDQADCALVLAIQAKSGAADAVRTPNWKPTRNPPAATCTPSLPTRSPRRRTPASWSTAISSLWSLPVWPVLTTARSTLRSKARWPDLKRNHKAGCRPPRPWSALQARRGRRSLPCFLRYVLFACCEGGAAHGHDMVFNSVVFLFCFMPLALLLYYLAPGRAKNAVLLLESVLFYCWAGITWLPLIAVLVLVNYLAGLFLGRRRRAGAGLCWCWPSPSARPRWSFSNTQIS